MNTHLVVPIQKLGQTSLVVAINDPTNHIAAEDIRFHTGLDVSVVAASEAQIKRAIERYYGNGSQTGFDQVMKEFDESEIEFDVDEDKINVVDLEKSAEDAPVVKLVNLILVERSSAELLIFILSRTRKSLGSAIESMVFFMRCTSRLSNSKTQ